jgi:hypothetical protein
MCKARVEYLKIIVHPDLLPDIWCLPVDPRKGSLACGSGLRRGISPSALLASTPMTAALLQRSNVAVSRGCAILPSPLPTSSIFVSHNIPVYCGEHEGAVNQAVGQMWVF